MGEPVILCIDDDANALWGLKSLLELNGYEVLTASNGQDGLELFSTELVDAVILDYQMPEMTGDAVAATMKRLKPYIPVMLLSGAGRIAENALSSVDVFVPKGPAIASVPELMKKMLNNSFFTRWLNDWTQRAAA